MQSSWQKEDANKSDQLSRGPPIYSMNLACTESVTDPKYLESRITTLRGRFVLAVHII